MTTLRLTVRNSGKNFNLKPSHSSYDERAFCASRYLSLSLTQKMRPNEMCFEESHYTHSCYTIFQRKVRGRRKFVFFSLLCISLPNNVVVVIQCEWTGLFVLCSIRRQKYMHKFVINVSTFNRIGSNPPFTNIMTLRLIDNFILHFFFHSLFTHVNFHGFNASVFNGLSPDLIGTHQLISRSKSM